MICKKCSAQDTGSEGGRKKCCIDHCKFNIPANHTVCVSHSRKRGLCECCGHKIGARRKGKANPNE